MMRLKALLCPVLIIALFLSCAGCLACAQTAQGQQEDAVVVYYFHGNFRCQNCYNMEQWTKELMDTCFKGQVGSGKIVFKMFNTDEKANEHFLNDYKLYTKSIVLSLVKGGKEVKYENLAKIWDCLRSKQKFQDYVMTEIEKYLKEI
jgi:hypothetical protein